MDIKSKVKKNLSIYSNTLLAIAGISALSFITKTEAVVRPGVLSRVVSGGRSIVRRVNQPGYTGAGPFMIQSGSVRGSAGGQLTTRLYESRNGDFKANYQKFTLPGGKEIENTGLKSVHFRNTRGEEVIYSEPQSAMVKLMLPNNMLVKEKYIDRDGIERIYLGVKGAGGVQDTVTPVTTTSVKPKKHTSSRKPSRFPKPGLSTIQEED